MSSTDGTGGLAFGGEPRPAQAVAQRQLVLRCLAVLSGCAAVIHFVVTGEHFTEYWAFGVFMLAAAFVQSLWAVAAISIRSRWLVICGLVINAGIVAVYAVTRIAGTMIGPDPHEVEPIGFGDGFCTALEIVIAVGCVWLLAGARERTVRRAASNAALAVTATITAALLSVALLDGGPEMSMSDEAGNSPATAAHAPMKMPAGTAKALKLATGTPGGAITMPDSMMKMPSGMKMASAACTTTPTPAQQRGAVQLVRTNWRGAKKYQRLSVAKAAGYRAITPTGLAVVHYINSAYYRRTLLGGAVLSTTEPQSLVYANTPKGAVLVAAMYIMSPFAAGAPAQPGGCLTQWHLHTNLCFSRFLAVVATTTGGTCPAGSTNRVTPPMLHVWFVPIPGGPTTVDAPDAQVVKAAGTVKSPANPRA